MQIYIKVTGTMISALANIVFNIQNILQSVSPIPGNTPWEWWILGSSVGFIAFASWWIISLELESKNSKSKSPNLIFTESRETPLWENNVPKYHGLQAWFVNKPKIATEDATAKDVTARIHFYNRETKKKLSVYGLWVQGQALDFVGYVGAVNVLDRIPPNDEPRKLAVAVKWQEDDSAYPFVKESVLYSTEQDFREKGREIEKGTHYVEVEINGVGINQESFWFILENPGAEKELSLSQPIEKPDLRKEGFQ